MTQKILKPGQILTGTLFNEPMRVETVRQDGPDTWVVGVVGSQSERFRSVTLTSKQLEGLTILDTTSTYDGDGKLLRLGLHAYSLGIAYEFDPYFGLSISRVDPLPHQLEAVYDYLLKLARVKFLLADDAGAGKTIMAGLLIRELKLRGLAERVLVVCPANLTFQWQRELKEKFDEKFKVIKGSEIRDQFGINQWMEQNQIITSLDLAKRSEILQGLRQAHWELVIVDEAHRMSAADREHKTQRYRLGELLRDSSDHLLLLTATPHKGDPVNFTFFLQLLDEDAYADVRSIREAMEQRRAPFYLRRIKEAMVYFPERGSDLPAPRPGLFFVYAIECEDGSYYIGQTDDLRKQWEDHVNGRAAEWTKGHKPLKIAHFEEFSSREEAVKRESDLKTGFGRKWLKELVASGRARQAGGSWVAKKIFTKRIPHTVDFHIDGAEYELYRDVTRYVKQQSAKAFAQGDDPRARAIGFLMSLYQRRLASSAHAMQHSLENRAKRLEAGLKRAQELARMAPPEIPDLEELEEMEDSEREKLEEVLDAFTLAGDAEQIREEVQELSRLAEQAQAVEESGAEEKLSQLKSFLQEKGFFDHPEQRLLIFTEFKDTLDYLKGCLKDWGFEVGCIHGSMKPGSREEEGSRLYVEQQFKDNDIQILVATEAAGEGINLQCCHILFNYDIPWNPNRLEQRMGRIHRYGQNFDCLIFNFVATNTIEGKILQRLLEKLQEIRDALDDDAVFNVVGEVLPAAHIERVLRDYYAGRLGEADLEDRILRNVDERQFKAICQTALEGLASKKLNLDMLIERRAKAQERRVVPETIARFMSDSSEYVPFTLKANPSLPHTFEAIRTPTNLRQYESQSDWRLLPLATRYPRFSTDRETAEKNNLEWVTPGHGLFEALRRHTLNAAQEPLSKGSCFHSLQHDSPARMDVYRARVVDGLGDVIHERLFAVELGGTGFQPVNDGQEPYPTQPKLVEPSILGNFSPTNVPQNLPQVATLPEAIKWLHENALMPFLNEVRNERLSELDRIAAHVELSLTELLQKADEEIGKLALEVERKAAGAEGRLVQAESRHAELLSRREKRRVELDRQRALTLQAVERITSVLILPHPERKSSEVRRLQPDPEVEAIAMQVAMEYEKEKGRQVHDVHEKNFGYDLTSLDLNSGELRLIEVKGIGESAGNVLLTPNEKRVAEDRRDCYWLYVVTDCKSEPRLQNPIKDPARLQWHEVKKVDHYYLSIDAVTQPMQVREERIPYGDRKE